MQKYSVHDWVKFGYSEIGEYIGEGYTNKPLRNDEIVDLLNSLNDENEKLRLDNDYLNSLLLFIRGLFEENGIVTKSEFEKLLGVKSDNMDDDSFKEYYFNK